MTTFLAPPALRPVYIDIDLVGFSNDEEGELPHGTYIPFGANRAITTGEQKKTEPGDGHSVTVEWGASSPSPAFDDKVAR